MPEHKIRNAVTMKTLRNVQDLWDQLIQSEGCCSNIKEEDEGLWALWADLSPCSSRYWEEPVPEIPRIVSISEDDECHDSISDICGNRHCSIKEKQSLTLHETKSSNSMPSPRPPKSDNSILKSESSIPEIIEVDILPLPEVQVPSVIYDLKKQKQKHKRPPKLPPSPSPTNSNVPPIIHHQTKPSRRSTPTPPTDVPTMIYHKDKHRGRYGYA